MTIGTLGLPVAAVRRGLLTRKEAMDDIDKAISAHHLRISIAITARFSGNCWNRIGNEETFPILVPLRSLEPPAFGAISSLQVAAVLDAAKHL